MLLCATISTMKARIFYHFAAHEYTCEQYKPLLNIFLNLPSIRVSRRLFSLLLYRGEPSAPFAIGDGDLDPFGGGGPGMFMDPMRGRFPRGGIPPGGGIGMPGRLPR